MVSFNPESEVLIETDALYDFYLVYLQEVRVVFEQLDEKKMREGRPVKHTSDLIYERFIVLQQLAYLVLT